MTLQGLDVYRQVQVRTADPLELVLLLYDGLVRFLNEAEGAIAKRQVERAGTALIKAQRILEELHLALDPKQGDFADGLAGLYSFFIQQLEQANIRKDPAPVRTVVTAVRDLRDAWRTASCSAGALACGRPAAEA